MVIFLGNSHSRLPLYGRSIFPCLFNIRFGHGTCFDWWNMNTDLKCLPWLAMHLVILSSLWEENCLNSWFSARGELWNKDEHTLPLQSSPTKFGRDLSYTQSKEWERNICCCKPLRFFIVMQYCSNSWLNTWRKLKTIEDCLRLYSRTKATLEHKARDILLLQSCYKSLV